MKYQVWESGNSNWGSNLRIIFDGGMVFSTCLNVISDCFEVKVEKQYFAYRITRLPKFGQRIWKFACNLLFFSLREIMHCVTREKNLGSSPILLFLFLHTSSDVYQNKINVQILWICAAVCTILGTNCERFNFIILLREWFEHARFANINKSILKNPASVFCHGCFYFFMYCDQSSRHIFFFSFRSLMFSHFFEFSPSSLFFFRVGNG